MCRGTPYPGATYPFAYPIPCPGGYYEGMGYGTSKYMYTSSICMYCMHMFTREGEEHAVVPCHMCCAPAPCQHCSRTAGTTQNAVGVALAVQKTVKNFRLRRALLQPTNRA